MKKLAAKILSSLVCTAFAIGGAATYVASSPLEAKAAETAEQTQLFLPTSYEQYLALDSPSDVTVTDDYTAISDGNAIYIYDRAKNVYEKYLHQENTEASYNNVTKLQFDGEGTLYFLDAATELYRLTKENLQNGEKATDLQFSCSTFHIAKDSLFFTKVTTESQLSSVPLNDLDLKKATLLKDKLYSKPTVTYWQNELYFTDGGKYLWKLDPALETPQPTAVATFHSEIVSMTVENGLFACSDIDGTFTVYGLAELETDKNLPNPIYTSSGAYSALTATSGFMYAVDGESIRQYDVESAQFTEYEICASSASIHRLDGATDIFLTSNALLIADENNARLSIYDTDAGQFLTPIAIDASLDFLAANEKTAIIANATQAFVFEVDGSSGEYGTLLTSFSGFDGNVVGAACVDERYYLVTDSNYYYVVQETADGWQWQGSKKTSSRYAKLLTADAYGTLYIGCNDNKTYAFSETEFLSDTEKGTEKTAIPARTQKISVDYDGNVYSLCDGALYKNAEASPVTFDAPSVYMQNGKLNSFAFGIEENKGYLLYEGNYIAMTSQLHLPTVKTIPVNGADEIIFHESATSVELVKTKPNTLLVEFDIQALSGADVFPYLSYERHAQALTALKIGESGNYNIIAYFDESAHVYHTYLAQKSFCEPVEESEYKTVYTGENQYGYLTNAVSLYKFPYLNSDLAATRLSRGDKLTLLGEIARLDHAYYHVSYTDESGQTKTGYVPKAYVSLQSGIPPQAQTHTAGDATSKVEAWRLAYILLGFAAICILVDCLILRKKNEE